MGEKAGLYIHIPFCASKCPYCDFYSVKYDKESARGYVERICAEFEKYKGAEFDTVYLGGGTPSALDSDMICKIISASKKSFRISENSEITIECNPSKDLSSDFREYKKAGINRVSIGMQSAVKAERLALGRTAGSDKVAKTVEDARTAGIFNISLDLMIGTPKQTAGSLFKTFDFIKQMNVPHISAYMLKIEQGTPFYKLRDKLALPGDDEVADMYLETVYELKKQGLLQYEISNFAKPGFESRHNIKYWNLTPYLGIGKTAHSFWNGRRFYYDRDFNIVDDGVGGTEEEKIMLGMRLSRGVEKTLIKKDCSAYVKAGLMTQTDSRIAFTPKGFLVSNTILADIITL